MIVNLQLGEPIWRKINHRELLVDWALPGISVSEFIHELGKRYPELTEEVFGESGDFNYHFIIFLNGVQVRWSESRQTILSNDDEVMIMMPLSGG
ncbi:MAG: MoaD/ThiS family protein [Clostridia bacterium]|nr:MoaD/ThiS family protein [Clostridia bacterium]